MSDRERHPGLFQTAEGGWMTHEDFLKFVAGAFTAKGRHNRTSHGVAEASGRHQPD